MESDENIRYNNTMKVKEILNKKATVLKTVSGYNIHQQLIDYTQSDMYIRDILKLGEKYKKELEYLRNMETDSKEQLEFKDCFPCWYVGGTFPYQKQCDKDIIEYTNLLAIDIDLHGNEDKDFNKIRKEIFELPYVILVSSSIRGNGIYALILVENGIYTKEYYTYLARLWNFKYKFNIDTQCKNIGRKRFISYDENILIKDEETDIIPWKLKYIEKENTVKKQDIVYDKYYNQQNNDFSYEFTRKAIWYLLNRGYSIDNMNGNKENKYGTWYHIACDFIHFKDGQEMFVRFSNNSSKYKDDIKTILKKWNNAKEESSFEDVSRKWCGICKNIYGKYWYKQNDIFV